MSLRHKKLVIPERCSDYPSVKWTKGASLDKIAKSYGHKDGKAIWNHAVNKALVKKRKKPENLQNGDEIMIPPNEAEEKRLRAEVEKYNRTKQATVEMAEVIAGRIKEIEKQIDEYYKVVDVINRRKFDGAEERQLVETVYAVTGSIEKMLDGVSGMKLPVVSSAVKFDTVKKINGAIKSHRAKMKGGTIDDAQIRSMKIFIDGARQEIRRLEKQIEQLDAELDKAGARTIGAFCKDRTLKDLVFQMLKEAHLGSAN